MPHFDIVNRETLTRLIERALGDKPVLDADSEELPAVRRPSARKWVNKRFGKAVQGDAELLWPFTPTLAATHPVPEWALRKLDRGGELWWFPEHDDRPARRAFEARLARLAGWLIALEQVADAAIDGSDPLFKRKEEDAAFARRQLDHVGKQTLDQAEAAAGEWDARLSKRLAEREPGGDVAAVQVFGNGWAVLRMKTARALDRESDFMGNCIGRGGYDKLLDAGTDHFFSLRDAANRPHATLQFKRGRLFAMRGRANHSVAIGYGPLIAAFLNAVGKSPDGTSTIKSELTEAGLFWDGKRYGGFDALATSTRKLASGAWLKQLDRNFRIEGWGGRIEAYWNPDGTLHVTQGLKTGLRHVTALLDSFDGISPDGEMTEAMLRQGWYRERGRHHCVADRLPSERREVFADGDAIHEGRLGDGLPRLLVYGRRGQALALFAAGRDASHRLYALGLKPQDGDAALSANLARFLTREGLFLADAGLAAKIGVMWSRAEKAWLTIGDFVERVNRRVMTDDLRVHALIEGRIIRFRLRWYSHVVADIAVEPVGGMSPFHVVAAVEPTAEANRRAILIGLNALGLPTFHERLAEDFAFNRAARVYQSSREYAAWLRSQTAAPTPETEFA
ncbi:MAG: hypothetical protein FJX46_02075 [Alphaproteobacteria bacterium]|nr:hypothetical protein [Alphaproteobacteria bacterium]